MIGVLGLVVVFMMYSNIMIGLGLGIGVLVVLLSVVDNGHHMGSISITVYNKRRFRLWWLMVRVRVNSSSPRKTRALKLFYYRVIRRLLYYELISKPCNN